MSLRRHLRTIYRASGHGTLFPHIGQHPAPAPLGSDSEPPSGHLFRRFFEEVYWFQHSTHRHPFPGISKPLHLLQITDVHISSKSSWLEQLCEHLRGLKPDLLFLTGDIVTRGWTEEAVAYFLDSLPAASLGRYAILGNWEHWTDATPERWGPILEKYGVQLLVNDIEDFGDFVVMGTDDHLAGNWQLDELCAQLPELPTIALTHSPGAFNQISTFPIELTLAGHAHGGQIRLPYIGPIWTPKGSDGYVSGWYKKNGRSLFVSRGIGWSVAPVRWMCPPEICSIFLIPNNSANLDQNTQR